MDIKQYRNDFIIYIVDDEESIRSILKEALGNAGYQVQVFPDGEDAWNKIQQDPPHVILSDIRMPKLSGIDLLKKVRDFSKDVQFIIMTSHASLDTALQAIKFGAYDYLHKPFEDLQDVIITVDRTVEVLYLQFENEQLLEELAQKNQALIGLNARISREKEEITQINAFMADVARSQSSDDVLNCFLEHCSRITNSEKILYFNHLPAYSSFVLAKVVNLDISEFRGIGLDLRSVEPKDYLASLQHISNAPQLADMMREVFSCARFLCVPLIMENNIAGLVIVLNAIDDLSIRRVFDSFMQVLQVSYSAAVLKERIHDMAIKDPLTGLFNRRFFNKALEDEISKSRRSKLPVGLIYLDIDHFKKYNDGNGHQNGDEILKGVSKMMLATGRTTDIVARLGGEEFCIILPNTDKMGAAIRAEKLRRAVQNHKWPYGEKQPMGFLSISLGVSEYPSLARDAESLIKSADDALYQVKESTRNKVCLATAPEGFQPDYIVTVSENV